MRTIEVVDYRPEWEKMFQEEAKKQDAQGAILSLGVCFGLGFKRRPPKSGQ